MLDVYGHLMPGMDEAAADRIDAAYSGRPVADLSPICRRFALVRFCSSPLTAENPHRYRVFLVGATGIEPVTSAV